MSSQHLSVEHASPSAPIKCCGLISHISDVEPDPVGAVFALKSIDNGADSPLDPFGSPIERCRTNDSALEKAHKLRRPHIRRRSSFEAVWQGSSSEDSIARKRGVRMELPSFESLGISSSSSRRLDRDAVVNSLLRDGQPYPAQQISVLRRPSPSLYSPNSLQNLHSSRQLGATPLLTPPEETIPVKWNSAPLQPSHLTKVTQSNESSFFATQDRSPTMEQLSGHHSTSKAEQEPALFQSDVQYEPSELNVVPVSPPSQPGDLETNCDNEDWLGTAIRHTTTGIEGNPSHSQDLVRMVVQNLPRPALDAAGPTTVYSALVEAIQSKPSASDVPFITVTHAVPRRFDLLHLPTSPPATPYLGRPSTDYFNQTVFSNAAVVTGYHEHYEGSAQTLPASPSHLAAPSSVEISLLTRYIPPAKDGEYDDLFQISGRSILVDRLSELSTRDGTLLFIYPTKAGARKFASQYLSPLLDPILRLVVYSNNLFYNIQEDLGRMTSIGGMSDFEEMSQKMRLLCQAMSQRSALRVGSTKYEVVHQNTGQALLGTRDWVECFIEQEQQRMRQVFVDYVQEGGRMPPPDPTGMETSANDLTRQVLDGLRKSAKQGGETAEDTVEVGVFVIRRSAMR